MTAKYSRRRAWLFKQQNGRCYLQIGSMCRRAGGVMTLDDNAKATLKTFATIEHLYPRGSGNQRRLVLLACRGCNNRKGSALITSDEQLAYAAMLQRIWERVGSGQEEADAFARAGVPWFARDGVRVYAAEMPIDHSLPVDAKTNTLTNLGKLRRAAAAARLDAAPAPSTVVEALAQGGVFAVRTARACRPVEMVDDSPEQRRTRDAAAYEAAREKFAAAWRRRA